MAEVRYGSLQFREQIEFFLGKLDLRTATWRDIWQDAHDRAFVVAGAMKADLISDLRMAVQKGIDQGTTLEEFRRDFEAIVKHHGWTGWTGEGTKAGRAWRTKVIYETNLRTSYAAGRWAQLKTSGFPFLRYRHNDNVMVPRPHHVALDGKIYRSDDPFWRSAAPPNGFGCQCWIEGVSEREMERLGKAGPDTPPAGWTADEGWNYAPGASVADEVNRLVAQKIGTLPQQIGQDLLQAVVNVPAAPPLPMVPVAADAAREAARADVLDYGLANNKERLVLFDEASGKAVMTVDGEGRSVTLTPDASAALQNPENRLRLIHNHPSDGSLSAADLRTAALPGADGIEAVGHRGSRYFMRWNPGGWDNYIVAVPASDEAVVNTWHRWNQAKRQYDLVISGEAGGALHQHAVNTILARAGLITYEATLSPRSLRLLAENQELFDKAVNDGVRAVKRAIHDRNWRPL